MTEEGGQEQGAKRLANARVASMLDDWGCCRRCVLIFLGERSDVLYGSVEQVDQAITTATQGQEQVNTDSTAIKSEGGITDTIPTKTCLTDQETSTGDHVPKKQKYSVCITCIGLLQWGCSPDAIKELGEAIKSRGHDGDAFSLALALPICLSVRVHRVWILLLQTLPDYPVKGRVDHVGTVKDVWKNLVGPWIEAIVSKKFIIGQYLEFVLNVSAAYINDLEDCKVIEELCSTMFATRRQQHRKYAAGVFSKHSVEAAIKKISDQDFLSLCPDPPKVPCEAVTFPPPQCQQASLYMAGRYNKFCRELPQTPWFIEGEERKHESSVQELLCETLQAAVKSDDLKFSSSGREDVDVRCLGTGRPFVVEFINPCNTKFSVMQLKELQTTVNCNTKLTKLRDLQVVDRKDVKNLKEGEEEKTKAYCALCLVRDRYDVKILDKLLGLEDLKIHQRTPLRVLHRRSQAVRPRVIHKIKAVPVDDYYFKLHLTTQAGTYIKEFVHGDFGRTTPNLGMLLGVEVDIIALDVEDVALDWPPRCG